MAYTKIHAIKATVNKAVDYIINPKKTDDKILVSSYACSPDSAALDFKFTLSKTKQADENKAYHLIQSFVPGEVSYEEAHQVGQELAERLLGNKYSYIVSTHIDKGHIHNHIIFCAANNFDHKKYHDCKQTYYHIRKLSDELCNEHGLSVIKENNNIGKTYKEWQETKRGTSWKSILKSDINTAIKSASSYEEFLIIMRTKGYQIMNESFDTKDGKYIKFLAPGTKKWIRGRENSLGADFTKERIRERIEEKPKKRASKLLRNKGIGKFINTENDEKFQNNIGLQKWANKENLKIAARTYAAMNEKSFQSMEELEQKLSSTQTEIKATKSSVATLEHQMKGLAELIKYAQQYQENKPYHDHYLKAKNKEAVSQKYDMQLTLYGGAKNILEKSGIRPRDLKLDELVQSYNSLLVQKKSLVSDYKGKEKELRNLQKFKENITSYMEQPSRDFSTLEHQKPSL